jgi:hypothetical protein
MYVCTYVCIVYLCICVCVCGACAVPYRVAVCIPLLGTLTLCVCVSQEVISVGMRAALSCIVMVFPTVYSTGADDCFVKVSGDGAAAGINCARHLFVAPVGWDVATAASQCAVEGARCGFVVVMTVMCCLVGGRGLCYVWR